MAEKVIGVLASGRGSNFQAIIDNIARGTLPVEVGVLICDQENAYALERAKQAAIPALVIKRSDFASKEDFEERLDSKLREHKVELIVLAGFMKLLSASFIKNWPQRIMNIHPSLLPSFAGLHPQQQALTYGAKISGCTVHFVDEGMDTGPIILQKAVPVFSEDSEAVLAERILAEEHQLYSEAIKLWAQAKLEVRGRIVRIKE